MTQKNTACESFTPPSHDCSLCPRLRGFINENRSLYPHFFNGPVPSFGPIESQLLIVGLAPGLQGANATGRPFTGDYAGDILYPALLRTGFASGSYTSPRGAAVAFPYQDKLVLNNCRISNAVRCVPPENKPETAEIKQCNAFLTREIEAMPHLQLIISLGTVSHNAVLRAIGHKASHAKFTHGAVYAVNKGLKLLDSYHCSRYNINTGTLTKAMFEDIVVKAAEIVGLDMPKAASA